MKLQDALDAVKLLEEKAEAEAEKRRQDEKSRAIQSLQQIGDVKKQMLDEHKKIMSEKVSKAKTDYWIKWREAHPNYKDDWKKYIPKGVSEENREMYSKQVTQRNYIKYKCVHCGKETNIGNLNRWHNDNCKEYDGDSKNKEKE